MKLVDQSPLMHDLAGHETTELEAAAHLYFACPGCGEKTACVALDPVVPGGWTQTGSLKALTLRPSIRIRHAAGVDYWHGYLTKGEIKPC